MEEVENFGAADAGEEILVAAGKADHLVRENGADDDELIVVEHGAVDFNRDVHLEKAARQLADFLGRYRAEVGQGGGVVPGVVEQAHTLVFAGPLGGGDLQAAVDRFLGHRRVRAQGDHDVEAFGFGGDEVVNHAEKQADRGGARGIGDDQQHTLAGEAEGGEGVGGDGADLVLGHWLFFAN